MAKSKSKRAKLLSHSRPPTAATSNAPTGQSSKATRATIRAYHTLQKRLSLALSTGDTALAESLQSQLAASGGLEAYQAASTLGQSAQRGGDTSKLLIEWLAPLLREIRPPPAPPPAPSPAAVEQAKSGSERRPLRVLEVGALSATNALIIPGKTTVRRIDLRSNAPEIEQQDFMTLPVEQPWQGSTHYDIVSLSLVVNFVGDARGRGLMLQRTTEFLDTRAATGRGGGEEEEAVLPALFLVLPLPCVDNSRYLDEHQLRDIMKDIGYQERQVKKTNKLYYSLWQFVAAKRPAHPRSSLSKKQELRSGRDRNNFCITIA